MSKLGHKQGYA